MAIATFSGICSVAAQPAENADRVDVLSVGILPDLGYSLERVRTDSSLVFMQGDSLRSSLTARYWLRIEALNQSSYASRSLLKVLPNLDNTLYYYEQDSASWVSRRAGIVVPTDRARAKGRMGILLQGNMVSVFYVLVDLSDARSFPASIKPQVQLVNELEEQAQSNRFVTAWAVSFSVLFMLFLYNLHLYFRFGDRAVLYFLIVQVGGMFYITAYRNFFNTLYVSLPFNLSVRSDGVCHLYNLNTLLMHLSVALILYGGVQMTRFYLQTQTYLPRLDRWLRYGVGGYAVFTAVVAAVNMGWLYIDSYTLLYDNLLVLLLAVLMLVTGVVAYWRKLPFAPAYLYAHLLPLLFLLSVTLHHVLVSLSNGGALLLPDFAIISQAFCFSAAVVSRMQTLREDFKAKEKEVQGLAVDIARQELRHRELLLENSQIQNSFTELEARQGVQELEAQKLGADILHRNAINKDLQDKLEANQRELASTTLYVEQKNAMLAELKRQLSELGKLGTSNKHQDLSGVKSLLDTHLHLDNDWTKFRLHFEQVHPRFFEELEAKYPSLTKHEQRLYSYFHINLSTKEIAALLNIEPASVRRAKTRLFKKIAATDGGIPLDHREESGDTPVSKL